MDLLTRHAWRLALVAGGLLTAVGGSMHPDADGALPMREEIAIMTADPAWVPGHALVVVGTVLVVARPVVAAPVRAVGPGGPAAPARRHGGHGRLRRRDGHAPGRGRRLPRARARPRHPGHRHAHRPRARPVPGERPRPGLAVGRPCATGAAGAGCSSCPGSSAGSVHAASLLVTLALPTAETSPLFAARRDAHGALGAPARRSAGRPPHPARRGRPAPPPPRPPPDGGTCSRRPDLHGPPPSPPHPDLASAHAGPGARRPRGGRRGPPGRPGRPQAARAASACSSPPRADPSRSSASSTRSGAARRRPGSRRRCSPTSPGCGGCSTPAATAGRGGCGPTPARTPWPSTTWTPPG